jgi:hypothetical protein
MIATLEFDEIIGAEAIASVADIAAIRSEGQRLSPSLKGDEDEEFGDDAFEDDVDEDLDEDDEDLEDDGDDDFDDFDDDDDDDFDDDEDDLDDDDDDDYDDEEL